MSRFDRKAIFDEQVWSEVWLLTGRGFFLGNSVSKYDRKAVFDEQVWSEVWLLTGRGTFVIVEL